jgi:DNA-binding transcriptional LysR family regulator
MNALDWNLVRAFRATAEAGSLSAAARALGLTQPTLSRQIAALETALGASLFDRVGKRLALSATGAGLLEHARAMGAAADGLALAAAGRAEEVSGTVTISASDAFAAYLMPGLLPGLRAAAPGVRLSITASNALADLRRREADIAIRHVRPEEPELIGRLVAEATARFYASRSFLAARGGAFAGADLDGETLLAGEPVDRFAAYLAAFGARVAPETFRVASDNSVVLWEMARAGLGVAAMLDPIATRDPGMVPVATDLPPIPVPIWLVTHRELRTSRRIRLVFDALDAGLRAIEGGARTDGPSRGGATA